MERKGKGCCVGGVTIRDGNLSPGLDLFRCFCPLFILSFFYLLSGEQFW